MAQENSEEPIVVEQPIEESISIEESIETVTEDIDAEELEEEIIEEETIGEEQSQDEVEEKNLVDYSTHIQNIGWQEAVSDGEMSGTSGQSLRLEGIKIELGKDIEAAGGVEYRTHIQYIGWETDTKKDGEMSGTSGQSLRLEAIQIRLYGEVETLYDIYYRVHIQNIGWLDWAKNWEMAGSKGYSYRLEGIEIKMAKKNTAQIEKTGKSFVSINGVDDQNYIKYQTHIQNVGWQEEKYDGVMSGTSGRSLRLEGIKIEKADELKDIEGDIIYRTHIQNLGWENEYSKNGEMSGTSGKSLRLEAIQIDLTGKLKEQYDIYYRVHAQNIGWLDWAKNCEKAGTQGYSYRLEGIEIKIVKKNTAQIEKTGKSFVSINGVDDQNYIKYQTHIQNVGWQEEKYDGVMAGTSGQNLRVEGIKIEKADELKNVEGDVIYRTLIQNNGWESEYSKNGEMSGTSGKSLRLEAIQIDLTGELKEQYDIYYRVYAQNFGWLGWAKNGEEAGTQECSSRLEAIQIKVVKKGESAPGKTQNPFVFDKVTYVKSRINTKNYLGFYTDESAKKYQDAISKISEDNVQNLNESQLNALIKEVNEASNNLVYKDGENELGSWVKKINDQNDRDLRKAFNYAKSLIYSRYEPSDSKDYSSEAYALYGFKTGRGNCYVMASVFSYLAKDLGYDAHQIGGIHTPAYWSHSWVEVKVNGATYVCDPDFEYELGRNGFMFTYGSSGTLKYVVQKVMN